MKRFNLNKSIIFAAVISLAISGFADSARETQFKTVGTPEGFAINEARDFKEDGALLSRKVIIAQSATKSNQKSSSWEITAEDLPVTQKMCQQVDSALCDPNDMGIFKDICSNKCIEYGPEVVAYDAQREKLYLTAHTMEGGNAGWPLLGFVANLKTYKIEPFNDLYGPAEITLSPSGNNLLLVSPYSITTIDTNTRNELKSKMSTWKQEGKDYFYDVAEVKWLNDSEISYSLYVYPDKFSGVPIKHFDQVFDIKKQKVISSKVYTDK